mgnify:CR=1 FL=1
MSKLIPGNQKHLTLEDRSEIERQLTLGTSIATIASLLCKDPTTISKEIKRHRVSQPHNHFNEPDNACALFGECKRRHVCPGHAPQCRKLCRNCRFCNSTCKNFKPRDYSCPKLNRTPFVCNGCENKRSCRLDKFFYRSNIAHSRYKTMLVEAREGLNITAENLAALDAVVSPLILKGQSPYLICLNHPELNISEKTLYNYIASGALSVGNLELPKKIKYKLRHSHKSQIKDRQIFQNRTYNDFLEFTQANPQTPVVEMDTVLGCRGSHKVLLTFFFRSCSIMLAYLLNDKTPGSVEAAFDKLEKKLSAPVFRSVFPVILTDRGGEFATPDALEMSLELSQRTSIYYCDPGASWQKPGCEKNHEYIRKILPKGSSFDELSQSDINKMMWHINSAARESLNGQTPFTLGKLLIPKEAFEAFGIRKIKPDNVFLTPELLAM